MNNFKIYDWEPELINNNNETYFNQKMIYKAKVIANANICDTCDCSLKDNFEFTTSTYNLSGLILVIKSVGNYNALTNEWNYSYTIKIAKEDNPNEVLFESYKVYVQGNWEETFNNLFNTSLNPQKTNALVMNRN